MQADSQTGPGSEADELYRLSYASTQSFPMGPADLIGMLQQARKNNLRDDITGLLLHREDSFLQVIEGSRRAVLALYDVIAKDSRHRRLEVLAQGPIEEREFSDWQMGFIELDNVDVTMLEGFSNFLNEADSPRTMLKRLSHTRRLLMLFKALG